MNGGKPTLEQIVLNIKEGNLQEAEV